MIYLEMSRNDAHGGGAWSFPNCVWSPTEKKGGGRWPFWEKVRETKTGDMVLHLRGMQPNARFVGFSRIACDGFVTSKRPPDPGEWSFSREFYRADLENYTPFHRPISLSEVFSERRGQMEAYFNQNKSSASDRRNIFFVRQSGRLRCLNGAYLSEVDAQLMDVMFGEEVIDDSIREERQLISVETSYQLREVKTRLGQTAFASEIKRLYENMCCFPSCEINDPRFLVGAHIARWSDNENLRGKLGNGLCLCVFHDKAFELGLFTLDDQHRIYLNPKHTASESTAVAALKISAGKEIKRASVRPLDDALLEHWIRVDVSP